MHKAPKINEIGELMLASVVNVYPSLIPDTTKATTIALETGYPWYALHSKFNMIIMINDINYPCPFS